MEITIPTAKDAKAIAELNVLAWQHAYKGLMPSDFLANLSVEKREAGWRKWIDDPESLIHVSKDLDGKVSGYVAYAKSRDTGHIDSTAEIVAIYVDPGSWGSGIGTELLQKALQEISHLAFARTTLWVLEGNSRAMQFYSKHGFRPDDWAAKSIEIAGTKLQEVRYVLKHDA
jgi:GNAT superfamily N-acetyltransferase